MDHLILFPSTLPKYKNCFIYIREGLKMYPTLFNKHDDSTVIIECSPAAEVQNASILRTSSDELNSNSN